MKKLLPIISIFFWATMVFASTPKYYDVVTGDGTYSYYRLDQASGDFVPQIGGPTCVAVGGISYSQTGALLDGDTDTAAAFNGSTGYCATGSPVRDFPCPDLGCGWSIEFWFKGPVAAETPVISVSAPTVFTGGKAWAVFVQADGSVFFGAYGGGATAGGGLPTCQNGYNANGVSDAGVVTANSYHHVVVTTVGAGTYSCGISTCTGLGKINIYVDGVDRTNTTTFDHTALENSICEQSFPFKIARFDDPGHPTEFGEGTIDEITRYAYALTADQVSCHYNAGVGTPELAPADTVCAGGGNWPFTASLGWSSLIRKVAW